MMRMVYFTRSRFDFAPYVAQKSRARKIPAVSETSQSVDLGYVLFIHFIQPVFTEIECSTKSMTDFNLIFAQN